jgi:hypothetical protein
MNGRSLWIALRVLVAGAAGGLAQGAPLATLTYASAGEDVGTELRIEQGRLLGRVAGANVDAWALEVDEQGARFVRPGWGSVPRCDVQLHATVEVRDVDADGRIDARRGEYARVYATATWGGTTSPGAAVVALEIGAGNARLAWVRGTDTWGSLGLPAAAPAVVRPAADANPLLVLSAGWPRDALDPRQAHGELLLLDAGTGVPQPSPFTTDAALVSGVTALDLDADGATDRMYLADARLRVWRLALDTPASAAGLQLTATLLADLSGLAGPDAGAIQFAPDVAPGGAAARQWLDVTVGTSDRPGLRAARHFLVTVRDALIGDVPQAPLLAADAQVLHLPGPLVAAPLTLAGRRLVATGGRAPPRCDVPAVVFVTILEPLVVPPDASGPAPGSIEVLDGVEVTALPGDEFSIAWLPVSDAGEPSARCRFGDVDLPSCPAGPALMRDYWLRKDAP